jgi:solute carrier family 25 (mitochondrial dicarboxylate transporter), member 10
MLGTFVGVCQRQGFFGLYNGLSAALLRQVTYSTVRFGVYEDLKARYRPDPSPQNPKGQTTLPQLLLMSSAAGFLGGIAGNPGDVLNVRMQSDFAKPPEKRRNYKHALDGLVRMIREEGPTSIARGIWPNSSRALLMTSSQLASYDVFKETMLQRFGAPDNIVTHFAASLAAGFVATTICSPVDVVKTRIMSAGGEIGIASLLKETTKREGWGWMLRGWVPSFIRLGPQTIATMIFFEQHKTWYRSWKGSKADD